MAGGRADDDGWRMGLLLERRRASSYSCSTASSSSDVGWRDGGWRARRRIESAAAQGSGSGLIEMVSEMEEDVAPLTSRAQIGVAHLGIVRYGYL